MPYRIQRTNQLTGKKHSVYFRYLYDAEKYADEMNYSYSMIKFTTKRVE